MEHTNTWTLSSMPSNITLHSLIKSILFAIKYKMSLLYFLASIFFTFRIRVIHGVTVRIYMIIA